MIGRLNGVLLEKHPPNLLLDVNGVGYDVLAPMSTFYQLPSIGGAVVLHTHLAVSEVAQQLFGFFDQSDRALFRQLIKVNGVGPKTALGIMSGMESDDFVRCVADRNVSALVRVPGIGKKTAERLIIEMHDRLQDWQSDPIQTDRQLAPDATTAGHVMVAEAESALVALGYKPAEAAKAVSSILDKHEIDRSEELIRLALRSMMPK